MISETLPTGVGAVEVGADSADALIRPARRSATAQAHQAAVVENLTPVDPPARKPLVARGSVA